MAAQPPAAALRLLGSALRRLGSGVDALGAAVQGRFASPEGGKGNWTNDADDGPRAAMGLELRVFFFVLSFAAERRFAFSFRARAEKSS